MGAKLACGWRFRQPIIGLCQHLDRVRLLEHALQGDVPVLQAEGVARVPLPIAVNADSLATWFAPALAAVTGAARSASGCNSQPLGAMRYLAAASPAFFAQHFPKGVNAQSLMAAPSLVFNRKDSLQAPGP